MNPAPKRFQRHFRMQKMRGADMHGIGFLLIQHIMPVGIDRRVFRVCRRQGLGSFPSDVAESRKAGQCAVPQGLRVYAGNRAATNQRYPIFFHK